MAFALAACWWGLHCSSAHVTNPDALDYAQMGSELAEGHGFSTRQIFPMQVRWLAQQDLLDAAHWPNVYRFPLPTLVYAGFLTLIPDPVWAGVAQAGFFYVLAAPLLFLLACRCGGVLAAGFAVLLYLADPLLLESGLNGMSEALALFLVLLAFTLAVQAEDKFWIWPVLGSVCGLAFLARTNLVFLAPLAAMLALIEGRRKDGLKGNLKRAGLVLGVALIITMPWLVRNQLVAGNPLYSVATVYNLSAEAIPEPLIYRLDAPAETGAMLREYSPQIATKVWRQLFENALAPGFWAEMLAPRSGFYPADREDRSWLGLLWLALCFAGLFAGNRRLRILSTGLLISLTATFLLFCLVFHLPRFYVPFRPLLYIGASAAILASLRRFAPQPWRMLGYGIVMLLAAAVAAQGWFVHAAAQSPPDPESQHFPPLQPIDRLAYAAAAKKVPEDAVIASDMSTEIAALAQRRALRLPHPPGDLARINARYLAVDWLILGRRVLTWRKAYSGYRAWAGYAGTGEFASAWRFAGELPNGWRLYQRR